MTVDVVLLLEGTYPFVRGGVSSWVHQMIQGMSHLSFHLVFIGGHPAQYGEQHYTLPDNVVGLDVHYLMDTEETSGKRCQGNREAYAHWQAFEAFFHHAAHPIPDTLLETMFRQLGTQPFLSLEEFAHSKVGWQQLLDSYQTYCSDVPFTDFFWTYRNLYRPLIKAAIIARQLPKARLFHSISTGYAGFLGAGASVIHDTPLLISEHGIYTKERKIDLAQAAWIGNDALMHAGVSAQVSYIRQMWISFFEQLGLTSYHYATRIISLYEGNRARQIKDGAQADKTQVIPNGIAVERFAKALQQRTSSLCDVVGLVGRVVSIKDIKTFIRAIRHVKAARPSIQGWIVGPYDEDAGYYEECKQLVETLGLEDTVCFLGMQNVAEILPKLGVMVLTSISEAQPLVLLEGMAAGVPFVATDVGCCREIAEGVTEADRALGRAGIVVPIASPEKTAHAILSLMASDTVWQGYQQAGLARVAAIYDETLMYERYRALYQEVM